MSASDSVRRSLNLSFDSGKSTFAKLQKRGAPYRFERWDEDSDGELCLYYSFPSRDTLKLYTKRIPLVELVDALRECINTGYLTRDGFIRVCPKAQSAGECGFAVTGRCLELLGVAKYGGRGNGFILTDKDRASTLLSVSYMKTEELPGELNRLICPNCLTISVKDK